MATFSWNAGSLATANWTNATNWTPVGGPPATSADSAVISQSPGTAYTVTENFTGTIAALTIGSFDATLTFTAGNSLAVDGIALNDGTIVVGAIDSFFFGTLQNDNVVTLSGGTIGSSGTLLGSIVDTGLIEGHGTIAGPITNSGVVDASGGTLEITSAIGDPSTGYQIQNGSALKLDSAVTAPATFTFEGATGALDIGATFKGVVGGMKVGTSATKATTEINVNQSITSAVLQGRTLSLLDNSATVETVTLAHSFTANTRAAVLTDPSGGFDVFLTTTPPCYHAGTRILTPSGEKLVEDLAEGDTVIVLTDDGQQARPVKWIGERKIDLTTHPRRDLAAPIRVRRDAMGQGQPHRDLVVSSDHCLFVDGKLIPALLLVNDMTIVQERDRARAHWFHVELEQHGILLAEGLPAESYLDTGNRAMFANAGMAMLLHPDFRVNDSLRTWQDDACAPLVVDADTLRPIWQSFADRAETLGFVVRQVMTVTEPDLHIVVAGKSIAPVECSNYRYVFVLPRGTEKVVLASRASRPADIVRYLDDRRSLGVAVGSVTVRMGDDVTVYPADHLPAGRSGWHAYESTETSLWRWTDGAGELQFEPLAQAAVMEIRLSGTAKYIVEEIAARLAA